VLLRTTSLLQARVRVAGFREIQARRKSGRLRGLLFLHLKRDLEVEDRDWIGCRDPKEMSAKQLGQQRDERTGYGVVKRLQRLIAGMRTDLDAFSDAEAFALMTSGCNMLRATFDRAVAGFPAAGALHAWPFLQIAPTLADERADGGRLLRVLGVAGMTLLKIWKLSPWLRALSGLAAAGVAALLIYALAAWRDEPLLSVKGIVAAAALAALVLAAGWLGLGGLVKLIRYRKTLHQILLGAGLSAVGWLVMGLHLKLLNPLFLRYGKLHGRGAAPDAATGEPSR
jgi:hypothetical protein